MSINFYFFYDFSTLVAKLRSVACNLAGAAQIRHSYACQVIPETDFIIIINKQFSRFIQSRVYFFSYFLLIYVIYVSYFAVSEILIQVCDAVFEIKFRRFLQVNFLATLTEVSSANFQLTDFAVDYVAFATPNYASVKVAANMGGFQYFLPCLMKVMIAEADFDVNHVICGETWRAFEIWQKVKKDQFIKNN
ncbi:MAG: hypothetical protein EZS28_007095 [Streblomastix strix]|uniref:Uncharacterized protein n=1 Tax=Streblomastix strix TaxID=222440 RepID=A0A5J4WQM5_9EUKA|nr:MAG: hypothetical protein EZS28_007095 [Streblomastix strix]